MLALIDYGVGNLFSLQSSLGFLGIDSVITADPKVIAGCDRIILPGVGAFGDAARKLRETGLGELVCKEAAAGKPLLGICLGMQLLFEKSHEYGLHEGLGLLPGEVIPMEGVISPDLMIPHIGWNGLHLQGESPLLRYVKEGDHVYFVHSYFVRGDHLDAIATAEYDVSVTAAVAKGNVFGCQFHPEKSGDVGLSILRGFSEVTV